MKGDDRLIAAMNRLLLNEWAAKHQYSKHKADAEVWGYKKFAAYLQERIDDETKHAEWLTDRITFLGGTPAVNSVGKVTTGNDLPNGLEADLASEKTAWTDTNDAIAIAVMVGDDVSRAGLADIAKDEDDHIRDIEAFLTQIEQMGLDNCLSLQV